MPKRSAVATRNPSKWDRLSTRKDMEQWREMKRREIKKESWNKGGYQYGSFGPIVSMAVGDPYVDKGKAASRSSRHGQQFKGSGTVKGKTFNKFTSVCAGTEYIDPYQRRKREAQAKKAKNLHAAFRPSGKAKPRRTLYLSKHDAESSPADIAALLKTRRSQTKKKKTEFKARNLQTAPMAKGGYGVANTHIPIYGSATRSIMEYGHSEYDAERLLKLKEARHHRSICGERPFVARISKRGQTTFASDTAVYGKTEQTIYNRKAPVPTPKVTHPAPFRPSNPGKKGKNADANMTFGKYPEHIEEPADFYDAADLSLKMSEPLLPWKPNNKTTTFTSTSLVMSPLENRRRMRNQST